MKNIIYIFLITFLLQSCCGNDNDYTKIETITTDVYISSVDTYKYSKVVGYLYYKGIRLDVDNGNSGYYYKEYNLRPGDVIKANVSIYQHNYRGSDPYKNDVILSTSDLDLIQYETKK